MEKSESCPSVHLLYTWKKLAVLGGEIEREEQRREEYFRHIDELTLCDSAQKVIYDTTAKTARKTAAKTGKAEKAFIAFQNIPRFFDFISVILVCCTPWRVPKYVLGLYRDSDFGIQHAVHQMKKCLDGV